MPDILWLSKITLKDLPQVGGKNASLGEMITSLSDAGVLVPGGFVTTADAYRTFLAAHGLDARIRDALASLDVTDVEALARTGAAIRGWIMAQPFSADFERNVRDAFATALASDPHASQATWAVRSSATAEDLPDASFAGQHETFLHVAGIENVIDAIRRVFVSLYDNRAITYRVEKGYAHSDVALSAAVQRMIRSDVGSSGVMFSVDTESGFDQAVLVTGSYGLGEAIVQGTVNPDQFYVYKPALRAARPAILSREVGDKAVAMRYTDSDEPGASTAYQDVPASDRTRFCITDDQVEQLARMALTIEEHYGRPMDIEWAFDGVDGRLYIVQSRAETVVSRRDTHVLRRFVLRERGEVLARGSAVGQRIGSGNARVLSSVAEMNKMREGDVLVAAMTDPDWEPIMKRASAIVTDRGGRTCHAAIIARELGIPAVVGTGTATSGLVDGCAVTVSCAEGEEGYVYRGLLDVVEEETRLDELPPAPIDVMMNVGTPDEAFALASLPNKGVGLARLEFIVGQSIGVHPRALLGVDSLDEPLKSEVLGRTAAYPSPREFFVKRVAEGVATIAAAFAPQPVIVRMSDFKTNEYANLLGGDLFEPKEENPMLGWRGAARYVTPSFEGCFAMECEALRFVRDRMGLANLQIMIPFVRTLGEAEAVEAALARNGLRRGENGLRLMMMCEIPSNAVLADRFLDHVDGFSIGSNDMTQLVLGIDRDSNLVADEFDERDPAVLAVLQLAIDACNRRGKYVGICGQGPSDHPDLADWLVDHGIRSISLNPDSVLETWVRLAARGATSHSGGGTGSRALAVAPAAP
jgi:pyruvate,water dikinase